MTEPWIHELIAGAEDEARPAFRSELRDDLSRRWSSAEPLGRESVGSPRRRWLLAAVAAIGVVGAGAVFAVVGRGGNGTVVSTEPLSTVAEPAVTSPTTEALDTSTVVTQPPAVSPSEVDGVRVDSVPFVEWLRARPDRGLIQILGGTDTTARLIVDTDSESQRVSAGILLDDDQIVPLPDPELRVQPLAAGQPTIVTLGDRLGVIGQWNDGRGIAPELWLLDPATLTWSRGPELADRPMSSNTFVSTAEVDGGIVVALWDLWAGLAEPGPNDRLPSRVIRISDDLTVTPLDAPPDGIEARFDIVAGDRAFLVNRMFTPDGESQPNAWALDAATGTWNTVPNAPWFPCAAGDTCNWSDFEDEDRALAHVGGSLLVEFEAENLALLDPATMAWTDVPEPPFSLRQHDMITAADDLILAMPTDFADGPSAGTAGLFDLSTGNWSAFDIETTLANYRWTTVHTDEATLLGDHTTAPILAFDLRDRSFRSPTEAELGTWLDHVAGWAYGFRTDELVDAFSARD